MVDEQKRPDQRREAVALFLFYIIRRSLLFTGSIYFPHSDFHSVSFLSFSLVKEKREKESEWFVVGVCTCRWIGL